MKNRYKIDWHKEYDRVERPFGVYVRSPGLTSRWKYICAFKTEAEAQGYIIGLLNLPREIFSGASG